jgi:hypothetical protein
MNSAFARAIVAVAAVTALAACSSRNSILPITQNSNTLSLGLAIFHNQSSPCKIPNAWYFRGSCRQFKLRPKGDTKTLGPYHGLTFIQHFTHIGAHPNDATFVIGMGTNKADITGTFDGLSFPFYGSKAWCVDMGFNTVACPGTAVLYSLMLNASKSWDVGLDATPRVRISKTGAFPGAKCEEIWLIYNSAKKRYGWQLLSIYGKPRDGAVTFQASTAGIGLPPGDFDVFGFICY